MSKILTVFSLGFALFLAVGFAACSKKESSLTKQPPAADLTMKPDRVARTQVAFEALGEISRLERILKPVFKTGGTLTPPRDCKVTESSPTAAESKLRWETEWICGDDESVRGRKEVRGNEILTYDPETKQATYQALFDILFFEDLEPRAKAYAMTQIRRATINFDDVLDAKRKVIGWKAAVVMRSGRGTKTPVGKPVFGPEFTSTLRGKLHGDSTSWILDKGSSVVFEGALHGRDADRLTRFASGRFEFLADGDIALEGRGAGQCLLPVGGWRLKAMGLGETIESTVDTTSQGGTEQTGGFFQWSSDHCSQI